MAEDFSPSWESLKEKKNQLSSGEAREAFQLDLLLLRLIVLDLRGQLCPDLGGDSDLEAGTLRVEGV
jgi:hypothetical protein